MHSSQYGFVPISMQKPEFFPAFMQNSMHAHTIQTHARATTSHSSLPQVPKGSTKPFYQYDEYMRQNIENLLYLIRSELLGSVQQMFSLQTCPLQSPKNHLAHHEENAMQFAESVTAHMSKFADELARYRQVIKSQLDALEPLQEIPSFENLSKLRLEHSNQQDVHHRISNTIDLLAVIRQRCQSLWQERTKMHVDITHNFDEYIRMICSNIMKTVQRMCPEVNGFLQNRQLIERKIHEHYSQIHDQQVAERLEFYKNVIQFGEEQVELLHDFLRVSKALLDDVDMKDKTQAQILQHDKFCQQQDELERSINIWAKILKSQTSMNISNPILPGMLHELTSWLVLYQRLFLNIIKEWTPQMPPLIRPLAPVQPERGSSAIPASLHQLHVQKDVSGENALQELAASKFFQSDFMEKLAEQQQQQNGFGLGSDGSKVHFLGLLPLDPAVPSFLKLAQSRNMTQLVSNLKMYEQYIERYKVLEEQTKHLEIELGSKISDRAFSEHINMLHSASQNAEEALRMRSGVNQQIQQQHDLERRLQHSNASAKLLAEQLEQLKPQIESQKILSECLYRVSNALNTFAAQHGAQWMNLIEEESSQCAKWKSEKLTYVQQYLTFRSDTRSLYEIQLQNDRVELEKCLAENFADLNKQMETNLESIRELMNANRTVIAQSRELIDLNHRYIVQNGIDNVSSEIVRLTTFLDQLIIEKERRDCIEYNLSMQDRLILFVQSVQRMTDMMIQDKRVTSLLQLLDSICVEHNTLGIAPLPLNTSSLPCTKSSAGTSASTFPACEKTWIQILTLPDHLDASNLLSTSSKQREATRSFINSYSSEDSSASGSSAATQIFAKLSDALKSSQ